VIHFRDIKSLNVRYTEADPYADKEHPYTFQVVCASRSFLLGSSTVEGRDMWLKPFNVLFEFREKQSQKSKLIQGIPLGSKIAIP
jgi:hypothetical protein